MDELKKEINRFEMKVQCRIRMTGLQKGSTVEKFNMTPKNFEDQYGRKKLRIN